MTYQQGVPHGTLYVSGQEAFWQQIGSVLDQAYPHEWYTRHFADEHVCFALDVPFPVGPVHTHLSRLASLSISADWFPWNEAQPYCYLQEVRQQVFEERRNT